MTRRPGEPDVRRIDLPLDRVDLWHIDVDACDPARARSECLHWLDQSEHDQYTRFRFDRHKHLYLVSHALLRCVLSRYADIPPHEWRFVRGAHGKPALARQHALRLEFNLSHTKGHAAVGVTGLGPIGVDIEVGKPDETMLALARRFFAPEEVAALDRLPPDAAAAAQALELWTLKEAFMKAVGLGFALAPRSFACALVEQGPPKLVYTGLPHEPPGDWQLASFMLEERVQIGVAVRQPSGTPIKIERLRSSLFD